MAEVQIKCGESTEQYSISKVQYVNFFWFPTVRHIIGSAHSFFMVVGARVQRAEIAGSVV